MRPSPGKSHILSLTVDKSSEEISRYPPTDEVFFVQNAGAVPAGTGLNKSSVILKISLSQAAAVSTQRNASGQVNVTVVNANPPVINPNGLTLNASVLDLTADR